MAPSRNTSPRKPSRHPPTTSHHPRICRMRPEYGVGASFLPLTLRRGPARTCFGKLIRAGNFFSSQPPDLRIQIAWLFTYLTLLTPLLQQQLITHCVAFTFYKRGIPLAVFDQFMHYFTLNDCSFDLTIPTTFNTLQIILKMVCSIQFNTQNDMAKHLINAGVRDLENRLKFQVLSFPILPSRPPTSDEAAHSIVHGPPMVNSSPSFIYSAYTNVHIQPLFSCTPQPSTTLDPRVFDYPVTSTPTPAPSPPSSPRYSPIPDSPPHSIQSPINFNDLRYPLEPLSDSSDSLPSSTSSTFLADHDDPNDESHDVPKLSTPRPPIRSVWWNRLRRGVSSIPEFTPDPDINGAINAISAISFDSTRVNKTQEDSY
jgi:hypothetical protein